MKQLIDTKATIGLSVFSNRDEYLRTGIIVSIAKESDRPLVLWRDNVSPIVSEWRHIELVENQNNP